MNLHSICPMFWNNLHFLSQGIPGLSPCMCAAECLTFGSSNKAQKEKKVKRKRFLIVKCCTWRLDCLSCFFILLMGFLVHADIFSSWCLMFQESPRYTTVWVTCSRLKKESHKSPWYFHPGQRSWVTSVPLDYLERLDSTTIWWWDGRGWKLG